METDKRLDTIEEELKLMEDRVSFNADKLDDLLIEEFKKQAE